MVSRHHSQPDMFSLYDDYPIPGKTELPLCDLYGQVIEVKETVVRERMKLRKKFLPGHC